MQFFSKLFLFSIPELREDSCPPPPYLVEGVRALISALRTWLKREVSGTERSPARPVPHLPLSCPSAVPSLPFQVSEPSSEVPDHIRPNHLIKELTKEIRYLEVRREAHQ